IGLCWLIFTGYLALTEAFAPWLAGLITTGAIFLIVAILGLVGKSLITTASKRKITVGDNLTADDEALKEGFRRRARMTRRRRKLPLPPNSRPTWKPSGHNWPPRWTS